MSKFDNRYNIKFDRYNIELRLRYGTIRNWSRSALELIRRYGKPSKEEIEKAETAELKEDNER